MRCAGCSLDARNIFSTLKSCNREQKQGTWCGRCPKCLSVFMTDGAVISREQLLTIFGQDLFDDAGAIPLLLSLLGIEGTKPFECVGTRQESLVALFLSIERYKAQRATLPALLERAERDILPSIGMTTKELCRLSRSILSAWSDRHYLSADYVGLLKSQLSDLR